MATDHGGAVVEAHSTNVLVLPPIHRSRPARSLRPESDLLLRGGGGVSVGYGGPLFW